jgi:hypothetical protein
MTALIALAVTQPITVDIALRLVLVHLRNEAKEERRDRQILLNRIQAPEIGISQSLDEPEPETWPPNEDKSPDELEDGELVPEVY